VVVRESRLLRGQVRKGTSWGVWLKVSSGEMGGCGGWGSVLWRLEVWLAGSCLGKEGTGFDRIDLGVINEMSIQLLGKSRRLGLAVAGHGTRKVVQTRRGA
jgi:hypothetical protein